MVTMTIVTNTTNLIPINRKLFPTNLWRVSLLKWNFISFLPFYLIVEYPNDVIQIEYTILVESIYARHFIYAFSFIP